MRIRAAAVGVCVVFNRLFNLAGALVFPPLLDACGAGLDFRFFAVLTALAFAFVAADAGQEGAQPRGPRTRARGCVS